MTLEEKLAAQSGAPPGSIGPEQQNDLWGNLGAGGYSALNEGLLGLPDFLVKNVGGSKNYQDLKDFREAHKLASDIGGGLGTVGSFLIPGGAIAKGAGLGLKALGAARTGEKLAKAGEFLGAGAKAGDTLGTLAVRGAGQAAEQAVPRALTNLDFTSPEAFQQSAASSLDSIPASLATGAGAGALLGKLASKFAGKTTLRGTAPEGAGETLSQFGVSEARKAVNNATLASAGLQTRAVRSASKALGLRGAAAGKHGDDYVDELAQGIRDYGINGKRQWDALVDKTRQKWDEIETGFQKNAPPGWNARLADDLIKDPSLLQHLAEAGNESAATQQLLDSVSHLSVTPDLGTVRNKLSNIIKSGLHSTDGDASEKARMALAIKGKIDDFVEQTSGVDVGEAKGLYKLIQPFLWQEGKDIFTVGKPLGELGSPTYEKFLGGGVGAALGGGGQVTGDMAEGKDVDLGKALTGAVVGGLVGPAALGATRAIANRTISKGVRALGGALDRPGVGEAVEKATGQIPAKAAKAAALAVDKNILGQSVPPTDPLTEGAKADATEKTLQPAKVAEAKTEMTDRFKTVLATRLRYLHDNFYSDMDPEQFMAAVQKKTNNFSDMTANADLLYNDPTQRAEFLREYNAHLAAKKLDIDKALSPLAGFNLGGLKADEEGNRNRETLRELLLNRITGGKLEDRTAANEKKVDAYIADLQRNPALLADLARQLQSPMLQNLGVV